MPIVDVTNPNKRSTPISFTPLPPFPPGATPAAPPMVEFTNPPCRPLNATTELKPAAPPPPAAPDELNAATPTEVLALFLAPIPPADPLIEPPTPCGVLVAARPPIPPATVPADVLP
jgi:hypothetical protein